MGNTTVVLRLVAGVKFGLFRDHAWEDELEIYTNAPSLLDYKGTKEVGDLGIGPLRVVSVDEEGTSAAAQQQRYRDCGFFATVHRDNAIAYLTLEGRLENPTDSDMVTS